MRFILSFLLLLFSPLWFLSAQSKYLSDETTAYIQRYYKLAIRNMYIYHIPASITLAQGVLESGSGRSPLVSHANNHFGIKCKDGYNGPTYYQDDETKQECFRVYSSADASYYDHSLFLCSRPAYTNLFALSMSDYKSWALGLKKSGYATNPHYADQLIEIIEVNKLYEYDRNPEKYLPRASVSDKPVFPDNFPPQCVNGMINGVKCVSVQNGTTFFGIAKQAGLTVQQVKAYNNFPDNYVLKEGEIVYLQPKQRRYFATKYHYVQSGETMLSISQLYAMNLDVFKEMNHVTGNWVPVGKRLILHY